MLNSCNHTDFYGNNLVWWAYKIFGECIYNIHGELSLIFGLLAILCFAFAQFPQIWKNFKLKKLPGLSGLFIFFWLLGDASNLLGCILSKQLPTQLYQAVYFVLVDLITFSQVIWIYFRQKKMNSLHTARLCNVQEIFGTESDDEEQPLVTHNHRSLNNSLNNDESQRFYSVAPLLFLFLGSSSNFNSSVKIIGYVIGWISTVCYVSSRFPQILKNHRRKSTSGLSLWMFCCTSSGNIFYSLSLILILNNWTTVWFHLPWLLGAAIPLCLDIIILRQFFKYRRSKSTFQIEEDFID